ncbi:YchJ family protein [Flavobacterium sp. RHBU_3]|uniref:YchJ family protein n=1 Tax=Flavobacterium sp. RHBU_3 TaxID=3391184 RepID=UPI003984A2B3
MDNNCPCSSGKSFSQCCEKYVSGNATPETPEALMRSRYTAYTLHDADYIYNTTAPAERRHHNKKDILAWAKSCHWVKLEVLYSQGAIVEFKAYYLDSALRPQVHHERSEFQNISGVWYYKNGMYP